MTYGHKVDILVQCAGCGAERNSAYGGCLPCKPGRSEPCCGETPQENRTFSQVLFLKLPAVLLFLKI